MKRNTCKKLLKQFSTRLKRQGIKVVFRRIDSYGSFCTQLREIEINRGVSLSDQVITAYHEEGHYLCWKKKCPCMRKRAPFNQPLAEFHAELHAVKKVLEMNLPRVAKRQVRYIDSLSGGYLRGKGRMSAINILANRQLMKTPEYKELRRRAGL